MEKKNLSVKFSVNTGIKRGALKYNLEGKHSRCNSFWWISRDEIFRQGKKLNVD